MVLCVTCMIWSHVWYVHVWHGPIHVWHDHMCDMFAWESNHIPHIFFYSISSCSVIRRERQSHQASRVTNFLDHTVSYLIAYILFHNIFLLLRHNGGGAEGESRITQVISHHREQILDATICVLGGYILYQNFKSENTSCHTSEWVISHVWLSHVTNVM